MQQETNLAEESQAKSLRQALYVLKGKIRQRTSGRKTSLFMACEKHKRKLFLIYNFTPHCILQEGAKRQIQKSLHIEIFFLNI
jgi:hypothetical protein